MAIERDYVPENNLMILFLLVLLTGGLYLFWWLAKMSLFFDEDPVTNILLTIFTAGIWGIFLGLKYMQKSEKLNNREMKWYMFLFFPLAFLVVQHNINEYYFPGH